MSLPRTAAEKEEEAELNALRDQAQLSALEAGRTLAEVSRRLTIAAHPGKMLRRRVADARVAAFRALPWEPGKIAGQRGARRLALAAIPVFVVAVAYAYTVARGKADYGKVRPGALARAGVLARRRRRG
jgi:hypothetical protein